MGVLSERHAPTSDKNTCPGSSRRTSGNAPDACVRRAHHQVSSDASGRITLPSSRSSSGAMAKGTLTRPAGADRVELRRLWRHCGDGARNTRRPPSDVADRRRISRPMGRGNHAHSRNDCKPLQLMDLSLIAGGERGIRARSGASRGEPEAGSLEGSDFVTLRTDAFLTSLRRDSLRAKAGLPSRSSRKKACKLDVSEGWRRERDSNPRNAFL